MTMIIGQSSIPLAVGVSKEVWNGVTAFPGEISPFSSSQTQHNQLLALQDQDSKPFKVSSPVDYIDQSPQTLHHNRFWVQK